MPGTRIVAVYARVSTEKEAQLYALENQKQYYQEYLKTHPEWSLYKMYVDEGLSGTATRKRQSFIEMINDAKKGRFDLIITREVSRFARNTVDTLVYTRQLKELGIEVFFIEDNIWTFHDDDGELKLTIIATLAQNESKKISSRAKAGQRISFLNGVMYGNGNILGYERQGKELIVNEKQAETVRTIFKLYLSGYGLKKICYELEQRGYLTSGGSTKWACGIISRILSNAFYCGKIVYRKSYSESYLTHKMRKNNGEEEQIIVHGNHQPIISEEDYERVQRILSSKTAHTRVAGISVGRGKKISADVWVRKMRCCCGKTFGRRIWHRKKEDGSGQCTYRCRSQIETGSVATRINHGLSIDGVCDTPWVQRWKLEVMLHALFKHMWDYRDFIIENALEAVRSAIAPINDGVKAEKQLKVCERKLENLLDLYLDDRITKETYLNKKESIEYEKECLTKKIRYCNITNENAEHDLKSRINGIAQMFERCFSEKTNEIPDEIIDAFVEKIIVHRNHFEWFINCNNRKTALNVIGSKNVNDVVNFEGDLAVSENIGDVVQRSTRKKQPRRFCLYSCFLIL